GVNSKRPGRISWARASSRPASSSRSSMASTTAPRRSHPPGPRCCDPRSGRTRAKCADETPRRRESRRPLAGLFLERVQPPRARGRASTAVRGQSQYLAEAIDLDRLDEVHIEAGAERLAAVAGLAIARERDQKDALTDLRFADSARHFEAADAGQSQVDQRDVGKDAQGALKPGDPISRLVHLVPGMPQEGAHHRPRVII